MNAEEMANQEAENTPSQVQYTTPAELLQHYKRETITTSNGHTYEIQSFVPGNLLIDIGSPVVLQFTETDNEKPDPPVETSPREQQNIGNHIKQIVCDHVTSLEFSPFPQHLCPENVVSINQIAQIEILEIYRHIRDLSFKEVNRFQGAGNENPDG